jgi:hypothetical protein
VVLIYWKLLPTLPTVDENNYCFPSHCLSPLFGLYLNFNLYAVKVWEVGFGVLLQNAGK